MTRLQKMYHVNWSMWEQIDYYYLTLEWLAMRRYCVGVAYSCEKQLSHLSHPTALKE